MLPLLNDSQEKTTRDTPSNWLGVLGPNIAVNKNWIERIVQCFHGYELGTVLLGDEEKSNEISPPLKLKCSENIQSFSIDFAGELNNQRLRNLSKGLDLLLLDALSFRVEKQIVIIDTANSKNFKYLDKIREPWVFILSSGNKEMPKELRFLQEKYKRVPTIKSDELDFMVKLIEAKVFNFNAGLKTVIIGDDSKDESEEYTKAISSYEKVKSFCEEVYFIPKSGLENKYGEVSSCIENQFSNMKVLGKILSAFMHDRNSAWLVLSSNLVELNEYTLRLLLSQRVKHKNASVFYSMTANQYLPDFCIWEPKSFSLLLDSVYYSDLELADSLPEMDIKHIELPDLSELDTPNIF